MNFILIISLLLIPKIVVTGDSIASGYGDIVKGGYVTRTQYKMPRYKFINHGIPSITSYKLYNIYNNEFNSNTTSKLKRNIRNANIIFIDVGRNDYWVKLNSINTVNTLLALKKLFKKHSKAKVYITCLLPVARNVIQEKYVKEVNLQICLPKSLRFDTMPRNYLNLYGVHPTAEGYSYLSGMLKTFILKERYGR